MMILDTIVIEGEYMTTWTKPKKARGRKDEIW